jgi:hypothetical protein
MSPITAAVAIHLDGVELQRKARHAAESMLEPQATDTTFSRRVSFSLCLFLVHLFIIA